MSAIFASDGTIVENSISGHEPHALPEVYELVDRDLTNVIRIIKDETGDSDTEKYYNFLDSLTSNGESLGAIQGVAVENPLSSYKDQFGFSAVPTEKATGYEMSYLKEKDILSNITSDSTWWNKPDHVKLPISKDGQKMPLIVTTNDYSEKTPTFDEAKEIVLGVLERVEELDIDQIESEADEGVEQKTNNDGSDDDEMTPQGQIHGVGDSVEGNVDDSMFEFTATRFPNEDEWDTSIEESAYYVEDEWESPNEKRKVVGGSESSDNTVPDLTTGDLLDRYEEVDMPDEQGTLFMQRVTNDKLYDAESILARHE